VHPDWRNRHYAASAPSPGQLKRAPTAQRVADHVDPIEPRRIHLGLEVVDERLDERWRRTGQHRAAQVPRERWRQDVALDGQLLK
jgi:hypothetical protein